MSASTIARTATTAITGAPSPSVDALAAAVAAVTVAKGTDAAAVATLGDLVAEHFTYYGQRFAVRGILPVNDKGEVQARVWLAATGRTKAPALKDRTSGETSLGQHLSKLAKVATDVDYGLPAITDMSTARGYYDEILAAEKAAKDKADAVTLANDEIKAASAWLAALDAAPSNVRAAIETASRFFTHGLGAPHVDAFAKSLKVNADKAGV